MAIPTFVDQVTLHVYGGNGGTVAPPFIVRSSNRSAGRWR